MAFKKPAARPQAQGDAAEREHEEPEERAEREAREAGGTEVATRSAAGAALTGDAPGFLVGETQKRGAAPRGMSQKQSDNLVPLVYVLQSNSPQVVRQNRDKYIEGAAAGDVWLRNSVVQLVRGDEGVAFQPCYFQRDVVEWRQDRGGFVGRHADWAVLGAGPNGEAGGDVVDQPHPKDQNRMIKVRKSTGNQLVDTRYHSGFVVGGLFGLADHPSLVLPYVIPLSSTGHQFSREWTFLMNQMVVPGSEPPVVADSFARIYRLATVGKKNRLGEWFGWKVEGSMWVRTEAEYQRGVALFDAFARGEKRPEDAGEEPGDGAGAGAGDGGGAV